MMLKLFSPPRAIMEGLLVDHATGRNIIWATDDYADNGHRFRDEMIMKPVGAKGVPIMPRALKGKAAQTARARSRAEVSTPAWICRAQLDAVDKAWQAAHAGESEAVVECPDGSTAPCVPLTNRGVYRNEDVWKEYVKDIRLEIACGEGPYMAMRRDAATGENIPLEARQGILDRKLRLVSAHTAEPDEWLDWALKALKAVYGFEWQGDSLFLARKELLLDYAEHYMAKFGDEMREDSLAQAADVITWNVWQMDGLKGVVPGTCHSEQKTKGDGALLFDDIVGGKDSEKELPCPGCARGDVHRHNGVYAVVMDWESGEKVQFVDMMKV